MLLLEGTPNSNYSKLFHVSCNKKKKKMNLFYSPERTKCFWFKHLQLIHICNTKIKLGELRWHAAPWRTVLLIVIYGASIIPRDRAIAATAIVFFLRTDVLLIIVSWVIPFGFLFGAPVILWSAIDWPVVPWGWCSPLLGASFIRCGATLSFLWWRWRWLVMPWAPGPSLLTLNTSLPIHRWSGSAVEKTYWQDYTE